MDNARVADLLGAHVVTWRRVTGGYTPAERRVVKLADGRTAFVKAAVTDLTASWLRPEHRLYRDLNAPFMPQLLAWTDEDGPPMLVLEDLSDCTWPPPWTDCVSSLGLPRTRIANPALDGAVRRPAMALNRGPDLISLHDASTHPAIVRTGFSVRRWLSLTESAHAPHVGVDSD